MGNVCVCDANKADRAICLHRPLSDGAAQDQPRVLLGPVVGEVTATTANILLEVDRDMQVVCFATAHGGTGHLVQESLQLFAEDPVVVRLRGLSPLSTYSITWSPNLHFNTQGGSSSTMTMPRKCVVRTLPEDKDFQHLQLIAVSCNRLSENLRGDEVHRESLWSQISKICQSGHCDVLLHLGDQVYTRDNPAWKGEAEALCERAALMTPGDDDRQSLELEAARCLQQAYRQTWTYPPTAVALANTANLMQWSDNDVLNDFNTSDYRTYQPALVQRAMGVYRMYQRQLWDASYGQGDPQSENTPVEEWHFHRLGSVGIFMFDLRGNRINADGTRRCASLLSDKQKKAVEEIFHRPELRCIILCSELPFVWERPEIIRSKANRLGFLKDHWPYNLSELTWLLDLCFEWKAAASKREVLLLGGDLHISVYSVIYDEATGSVIRSVTTSPVANHVSRFYANLEGRISDRYSYRHEPLPESKTFCKIEIALSDVSCDVKAELVSQIAAKQAVPFRRLNTWY
ncbi:hypothetical protein AK812_SmicGene17467 [Symbiodinium microadriaticum]|uniref:PhoD-like phosphatase metallophosphatase domain-containing protein n=1 Tax=Symbiodinium microadriaticum TaxID=2951 RepID=A0A1Q9DXN2_SYMMI|nr:hypothetical protein AK812_SmicGene17467 [Symbiodinium microadriaticum]